MIIKSYEAEEKVALDVAQQMAVAARTAPKACGADSIETVILSGSEKSLLTDKMREIAIDTGLAFFTRDAGNIDNSHCIILIGIKDDYLGLPHCGLCGLDNCGKAKSAGAVCSLKLTDLGIAIGSAVSIAANNRIDNRVMYSAGKAALQLSIFDSPVKNCHGIPLATLGKSPFQDRAEQTGVLVTAKH